jgi:hypothetical protein
MISQLNQQQKSHTRKHEETKNIAKNCQKEQSLNQKCSTNARYMSINAAEARSTPSSSSINLQICVYRRTTNRTFSSASIIQPVSTTITRIEMSTWRKRRVLLGITATRALSDNLFRRSSFLRNGFRSSLHGGTSRRCAGLLQVLFMSRLDDGMLGLVDLLRGGRRLCSKGLRLIWIRSLPPVYQVVDVLD